MKTRIQRVRVDRLKELCATLARYPRDYGYSSFKSLFDIPNNSFYRVFYSDGDFSIDTYCKIAEEFGVSLDWLMGYTDERGVR